MAKVEIEKKRSMTTVSRTTSNQFDGDGNNGLATLQQVSFIKVY